MTVTAATSSWPLAFLWQRTVPEGPHYHRSCLGSTAYFCIHFFHIVFTVTRTAARIWCSQLNLPEVSVVNVQVTQRWSPAAPRVLIASCDRSGEAMHPKIVSTAASRRAVHGRSVRHRRSEHGFCLCATFLLPRAICTLVTARCCLSRFRAPPQSQRSTEGCADRQPEPWSSGNAAQTVSLVSDATARFHLGGRSHFGHVLAFFGGGRAR